VARGYQLRIGLSNHEKRRETFDGFQRDDYDRLSAAVVEYYRKRLEQVEVSTRGWNWGVTKIEDNEVKFLVRDKLAFEVPVEQIANSNVAGKTEVSMEFINAEQQQPVANTGATSNGTSKSKKSQGDQLVEMRFHIPGNVEKGSDEEDDDEENEEGVEQETAANAFHEAIKAKADIGQAAGDGIIMFKEVLVLTPRGRYDIDMFPGFLRLRGKTYDYKVLYSSVTRLFLLPKPDDIHVQFVVGLDPPIRQGQTRYPYLVLQFVRDEEMDAELNIDEETLQSKYDGKLKKRYEDTTFRIVTSLFRVLSGQKLIAPGNDSFESVTNSGNNCLKCNIKATEGLLYPLDKQLIWVSKQPIHIKYDDIHQVIFARVGGAVSSSKTFDLKVIQRSGPQHVFQSLNREEHSALSKHFSARKVRVKNEMDEVEAIKDILSDEDDDEEMEEDEEETSRSKAKSGSSRKEAAADAMDEDEDSEGKSYTTQRGNCFANRIVRSLQKMKTSKRVHLMKLAHRTLLVMTAKEEEAATAVKSLLRRKRRRPKIDSPFICTFIHTLLNLSYSH
jgi:structure-specific recognition protein 1